MTCFSSRNTSFWRHNDAFCDENGSLQHISKKGSRKNYNCDFMQLSPCSCDNTFIYGHLAGNLISFINCNFTLFYPIEMGFSLHILFLCSKNVCNVLNTAFQVFNVVTKNRRHLWRHTSRNVKNTFTMVNLKFKESFSLINMF